METWEFRAAFTVPSDMRDGNTICDKLFEAGCDDAIIGIGHLEDGLIALDFSRRAADYGTAIASAIIAVLEALPGSKLEGLSLA